MYGTDVYERVYFQDDYKQQFEALRSRYHDRTQKALKKRAVDHKPTPNVTSVIYLHDEPDGGVTISSGDFVEFFNNRYGGRDRIGAMRASLANAVEKAEKSNEFVKKQKSEKALRGGTSISCRMRFAKRHLMLVNALFAFMLMLSIALLGASGIMLERSEADVAAVRAEAAQSESVQTTELLFSGGTASTVSNAYLSCADEHTTEVYEVSEAESGIEMLMTALAYLW